VPFVSNGAFYPRGTLLGLIRTVTVTFSRRWLIIVSRRWSLILSVICNDFHRFFGRPLVLISSLRERSHRHHGEHRNQQKFS
jgi:hypothetical protein